MDNNVKSYRKPYNRPVTRTWWTQWSFYVKYMLREGTAIFAVLVALELMLITALPFFGVKPADAVCCVLSNPVAIILNIVSLVAVIFHAVTWFNLMPKAMRMFFTKKPTDTKLIPDSYYVIALWVATAVSSIVIILAFLLV